MQPHSPLPPLNPVRFGEGQGRQKGSWWWRFWKRARAFAPHQLLLHYRLAYMPEVETGFLSSGPLPHWPLSSICHTKGGELNPEHLHSG